MTTAAARGRAQLQVRLLAQQAPHGRLVEPPIGLGARPADGRPLAGVQGSELNPGAVDGPRHDPVEGVDLAHQMALAQPADGRVAGHLADRLQRVGDQAAMAASQPAWPPPTTITS
jgi:hypothetical protein